MSKSYILVNLAKESDERLLSQGLCGPMAVLLKRASDANFTHWLVSNKALLRSQPRVPYLNEGLIYALEVGKEEADKIIEAFFSTYPELKEAIMQAIRQVERRGEVKGRQEGIKQGRQEGRQEEKLGIARNMLRKGYTFGAIEELTGLSSERLQSLQ